MRFPGLVATLAWDGASHSVGRTSDHESDHETSLHYTSPTETRGTRPARRSRGSRSTTESRFDTSPTGSQPRRDRQLQIASSLATATRTRCNARYAPCGLERNPSHPPEAAGLPDWRVGEAAGDDLGGGGTPGPRRAAGVARPRRRRTQPAGSWRDPLSVLALRHGVELLCISSLPCRQSATVARRVWALRCNRQRLIPKPASHKVGANTR